MRVWCLRRKRTRLWNVGRNSTAMKFWEKEVALLWFWEKQTQLSNFRRHYWVFDILGEIFRGQFRVLGETDPGFENTRRNRALIFWCWNCVIMLNTQPWRKSVPFTCSLYFSSISYPVCWYDRQLSRVRDRHVHQRGVLAVEGVALQEILWTLLN